MKAIISTVLGWLGLGWVKLALIAVALASVVGFYEWKLHEEHAVGVAEGKAQVQAKWDAEKVQLQTAAIQAQQDAAAETARRLADQQEASRVHEKQLSQARADAAAADTAAVRLRKRIAELAAAPSGGQAPSNPAAAPVSTPAARVGDVAGSCVTEYAALAAAARRGWLAGNECATDYEALMPR